LPHQRKIAVIGLGYVGLPVAVAFARSGVPVVGFDIDAERINELRAGRDRTREVDNTDLKQLSLHFECEPLRLAGADFYIVTVPTPIDGARRPDLRALVLASETVGKVLKRGDIVVYESTVYPGTIEEECLPVLEKKSALAGGCDFTVGYSPERINPGDKEHRFETITKVVAAQDARTLDILADVYGSVVKAGIHRAPSIKVAEAAKVIENTQRDLNIALMNELSAIFHQLGIDTRDVLTAASTKWNFLNFQPTRRRPLHRRRSLLPDISGGKGRLSSGNHSRRAPHQRRYGRADCAGMHARLSPVRPRQSDRDHSRHDLQGECARHSQFEGDRHCACARARGRDCAGDGSARPSRGDDSRVRN
jgi:3-hydroxyisobutyrate dehydrogenase-like beta-hydroxyacid dehydrogenase